ncbi:tail assembly chaperone [Gordonia phage Eyre]|uniref:Tail assembly chaperone n=1 Tax=Gordonia phage Eyre TaxID=1887646 RepID=A0A1B3AZW0_9CAUD|nr:tail assembly chaperone [Gordonia phage Eyre]AOE44293.1 tail assembly chaperone [Gordonia phage Eyre]
MTQFDEWLDSSTTVVLGKDDREFRVEPPSALTMIAIHRQAVDGLEALTDYEERQAIISVLGRTWQEMAEHGIPDLVAQHAGRAVLVRYLDSADAALNVWTFQPPKAEAAPVPERPAVSILGVAPDDAKDPPGTINDYDPGGGPYDPVRGIRVWAYPMEFAPVNQQQKASEMDEAERATWSDIFEQWDAIEIDFATILRIDLSPALLAAQSWRWFEVRLSRVLGDPDTLTSRLISIRKAVRNDDASQ